MWGVRCQTLPGITKGPNIAVELLSRTLQHVPAFRSLGLPIHARAQKIPVHQAAAARASFLIPVSVAGMPELGVQDPLVPRLNS